MSVQMESTPEKTINNKQRIFRSLQFLIETFFLAQFIQPFFSSKWQCLQEENCYMTSTDLRPFTETSVQENIQAYA